MGFPTQWVSLALSNLLQRELHGVSVLLPGDCDAPGESGIMGKVNAFHTNSPEAQPEHREVYHDRDDCYEGKKILQKHKESGTGGKKRCKECVRLG